MHKLLYVSPLRILLGKWLLKCDHNAFDCYPWYFHDDIMTWKHFLYHRPIVRVIHQSPVDTLNKDE